MIFIKISLVFSSPNQWEVNLIVMHVTENLPLRFHDFTLCSYGLICGCGLHEHMLAISFHATISIKLMQDSLMGMMETQCMQL